LTAPTFGAEITGSHPGAYRSRRCLRAEPSVSAQICRCNPVFEAAAILIRWKIHQLCRGSKSLINPGIGIWRVLPAVKPRSQKGEPQNTELQNFEFRSHSQGRTSAVLNSSFDILRFRSAFPATRFGRSEIKFSTLHAAGIRLTRHSKALPGQLPVT
jgi:hypothetical protein